MEVQPRRRAARPTPVADRGSFPHAATIESGLGVQLPGTWKVDSDACRQMGVPGFTDGLTTSFISPHPPLHVAVHEAVHTLQHAGLTRDGGLGPERHAAAIADELTAGRKARAMIDPSHGSLVSPTIRPYTTYEKYNAKKQELSSKLSSVPASGKGWDGISFNKKVRVSETLETLTATDRDHSKTLFATMNKIHEGNAKLSAQTSGVELSGDASNSIGIGDKRLHKVHIKVRGQPEINPWMPCRCVEAAVKVMGITSRAEPEFLPNKGQMVARYKGDKGDKFSNADQNPDVLAKGVLEGMTLEEYKAVGNPDQFDRDRGINQYAVPGVGEAYSLNPPPAKRGNWNYHFAAVVMAAGGDRVTLENIPNTKKANPEWGCNSFDWYFQTYGTASGQTFYDAYRDLAERGDGGITMVAHHPDLATLPTSELVMRHIDQTWRGWPIGDELQYRWFEIEIDFKKFPGGGETEDVMFTLTGPDPKARYESAPWTASLGPADPWWLRVGDIVSKGAGRKDMKIRLTGRDGQVMNEFSWPFDPGAKEYAAKTEPSDFASVTIHIRPYRDP